VLLALLAQTPACGDSQEPAHEEHDVQTPRQAGQEQFQELLSQIRIEATVYGGLGARITLDSDTVQVRASWYGVDEPVLYVDHCVMVNVYSGVDGEPPTQEKHCTSLTDHETCTFSEDGKTAECIYTWVTASPDEALQGQNYLPEQWSIVPSNNASLGGNYQGAEVVIPLPSANDCVVYYDEETLPQPGSFVPLADGSEIRWSGATGISELLAKKYPGRGIVRKHTIIQVKDLPEYDIFSDICVDQEVLVDADGKFHFSLAPTAVTNCPAGVALEFLAAVVRNTVPEGFSPGSSIRYGNVGYPLRLGLQ
jgi:hypothetical protein